MKFLNGDFIHPEQKMPSFLQYGNGIYDGLELFRRQDEEKIVRLINNRKLEPIKLVKQCRHAFAVLGS